MVSRDGQRSVGPVRDPDRGQLVLVGGVLIAVMLVGLVIVFNSALFTENVDKGGSAESARDGTEFASELQRNSRTLTIRVNHDRRYVHGSEADIRQDLATSIVDNFSGYNAVLSETPPSSPMVVRPLRLIGQLLYRYCHLIYLTFRVGYTITDILFSAYRLLPKLISVVSGYSNPGQAGSLSFAP
jgi:hypothetical protein